MLEQTFTAHIFPHKYYHQPISIIFLWFFGNFLPDRGEFCHFGVREVRVVGSGIGIFGSQLQCCILWCCLGCFRPRRLGRFSVRVFSHGKKWCWNWWVKRWNGGKYGGSYSCNLRILVWEFAALQFYDAAKVASISLDLVGIPHRGRGWWDVIYLAAFVCNAGDGIRLGKENISKIVQGFLASFFLNPCSAHDFKRLRFSASRSYFWLQAILPPSGNFCKFIRKRNFTKNERPFGSPWKLPQGAVRTARPFDTSKLHFETLEFSWCP